MEDVFEINIDHAVPPSLDFSISYPVIAEPPLLDGAAQDRLICDDDAAVAVRPVGELGAIIGVVAEAVFDVELMPIPE